MQNPRSLLISSASEDKEQQTGFYAIDGDMYQQNHFANSVHILVKLNKYNYYVSAIQFKSIPWAFCPGASEECKRIFTVVFVIG